MVREGQAGRAALVSLYLLFVLALLFAPVSTQSLNAQTTAPVLETAELRLWPEYDDPGLLVILAGQFSASTSFPLSATFPVPTGTRNVQATYQDASSSLINRPFEINNGRLTYELPSSTFQIEYYLDRAPSGEQREITYSFVAPYAINAFRVEVQQPARSAAFTLSPASETSQKGQDGLTYYIFNRRNVAAGEKLDITISYSKTDTGLSAPQLAVAPTSVAAQATPVAAPASASATNWLPWLLIGLGLVLLASILAYWLLSQRREVARPTINGSEAGEGRMRTNAAPPRRPTVPARPPAEPAAFCTNCGQGLKPEDRFCAQCGAPRRV